METFQPDPSQTWLIQPAIAHQLAARFGLTISDVRTDARDVATWRGASVQDLLTSIQSRRRLSPDAAATYLSALRSALVGGSFIYSQRPRGLCG